MVDKFEFLKSFNSEIYKNCKTAEFLINVMENFDSSLGSARIALEQLCAEENPSYYQYDSLEEKVRSFISRTNPDDNIYKAILAIKTNGNEGSHGNGSTRKAKDTIELLEQVLIWYVCGYRGKKYKEADFHPSELRYVYLYCKDLKSTLAKPEKTASGKKVVVEAKNDVVRQNTISISENKPDKPATTSAPEAVPILSAIDKEEKKRLKLERKAQEEAERKAKRNAERELRKQLQKEQKAKALEEAKRRNEEAVAKANAKLQAQEDKKLAKERELEQKRIRAEQRELRLEQKRLALEDDLRKQKEAEEALQQQMIEALEEQKLLEDEEEQRSSEQARIAARISWEKKQEEERYINECIQNGKSFALELLLKAVLNNDISVYNIVSKYKDRIADEISILSSVCADDVNEVKTILSERNYNDIPHARFFRLTTVFCEHIMKTSLEKIVWINNQERILRLNRHEDLANNIWFLFGQIEIIRNDFVETYEQLHKEDAENTLNNEKLFEFCVLINDGQHHINARYDNLKEYLKENL